MNCSYVEINGIANNRMLQRMLFQLGVDNGFSFWGNSPEYMSVWGKVFDNFPLCRDFIVYDLKLKMMRDYYFDGLNILKMSANNLNLPKLIETLKNPYIEPLQIGDYDVEFDIENNLIKIGGIQLTGETMKEILHELTFHGSKKTARN